ncbi:hypothetical protein [Budvicia aquatica]|uniref:hypothetical protein n=1 Tax=Budvicia aquatica TaxID=82979 RepID=UPI00208B091A|nr:hypothetical protein [Budvicia aquatica]GKX50317.1 hypothetical protein SOASR029_06260 [Budvicia aquatica]
MKFWNNSGLDDFLACHPKIRIAEIDADKLELAGEYNLKAQLAGSQLIERTYQLRLVFSRGYPNKLPKVLDEGGYFPRHLDYHTYSDGSFCLGSELKIKSVLRDAPSISAFFEKIVVRFLYSVSHRIEFGYFPYGELEHGEQGLIDDYGEMFGLGGKLPVLRALQALGCRKRRANKLPCPCGCGLRLGCCNYRFVLNTFRNIERCRWFRQHLIESFTPLEKSKKARNILSNIKYP